MIYGKHLRQGLPWLCVLSTLLWLPEQVEARENKSRPSTSRQQSRQQFKSKRRDIELVSRVGTNRSVKTTTAKIAKLVDTGKLPQSAASKKAINANPRLESSSVLVVDGSGQFIFSKGADVVRPIASITKLMTAMVVLDANLPMHELISITTEDKDELRHSSSRMRIGKAVLTREEMLRVALMSSENRAASALGRTTFPGGIAAFVVAMNSKAKTLGMTNTNFADATGLQSANTSSAADLAKMLAAARQYPLITEASTTPEAYLTPHPDSQPLHYVNTNRLVRNQNDDWEVLLSKTGFTSDAGRCLVMEARLPTGVYDFVFLNAPGKLSTIGDANRLKRWIEKNKS